MDKMTRQQWIDKYRLSPGQVDDMVKDGRIDLELGLENLGEIWADKTCADIAFCTGLINKNILVNNFLECYSEGVRDGMKRSRDPVDTDNHGD